LEEKLASIMIEKRLAQSVSRYLELGIS